MARDTGAPEASTPGALQDAGTGFAGSADAVSVAYYTTSDPPGIPPRPCPPTRDLAALPPVPPRLLRRWRPGLRAMSRLHGRPTIAHQCLGSPHGRGPARDDAMWGGARIAR
jgi:hypothetical protein